MQITNKYKRLGPIYVNTHQYTSIHIQQHRYHYIHIQPNTYHYIHIQTNTFPNKFFHVVCIGLYQVCSIQTNTHIIHANTYKYIPILNTNGDETRRVSQYGLASIWFVFDMYLVCIGMYLFVFACIAPRLTLRVSSPFVFRIGMYWHVFGMYLHGLVCILQTWYRQIQTITNIWAQYTTIQAQSCVNTSWMDWYVSVSNGMYD